MDWSKRLACHFNAFGPFVDSRLAVKQSESILILFLVVHANDFVIGREEGDGHADDQGEEAPSELLLNEEEFKSEHHKEQTADV